MLHSVGKKKGGLAEMLMGPEKAVNLDSLNSLEKKKLGKRVIEV